VPHYLYLTGQKTTELSDSKPERAREVWVDIGPHESDQIGDIVRQFYAAHPATVQRILDSVHRQPSLLVQDEAVVFVLSDYVGDLDKLSMRHLGVFLGKNFLVTAHMGGSSSVVEEAWDFILQNHMLDEGVDFALYEILYHHVRRFAALNTEVVAGFEALHARLLEHPYRDLAGDIVHLRQSAMQLRKMIHPELEIFALLKSPDVPYIDKMNRPYFDDVASRARELSDDVDGVRDGLSGMVEAYTSMQSNEINKVMKFLTILSVLALPATTIASIYGMNFYIPEIHWHYGYFYSLIVMFLITMLLLLHMRHRNWFR
jgi:magnesium transporter